VKHEADAVYKKWCAEKDAERANKTAQQLEQDMSNISKQRRKRIQAKRAFNEWMEARKQQVYYVRDKATDKVCVKRLEKFAELPAKHPVEWNPFTAGAGVKKTSKKGSKREKDPRGKKPSAAKPLGLAATATKARKKKSAAQAMTAIPRVHKFVREAEEEEGIELTETFKMLAKIGTKEEDGIELTVLNSINTSLDLIRETINL